ncbi:MAG: hypothetical protein H6815_03530 [Phycisphaeraceae bacterium]|nr:hypothetical protein [Phycisphaerales bacterium]MCB9859499.1 hypothetical protein [Phycisphaeraceae bacterium]
MSDANALDLYDPHAVAEILKAGAAANRSAECRVASIDRIQSPGTLIATGDLHDNPVHYAKLLQIAQLGNDVLNGSSGPHIVLHELIHADKLTNGLDFSYRALARVAQLKTRFPERVHALLANHELAQVVGSGIVKDGVRVVDAFNEGVEYVFGDDAKVVEDAIAEFIFSMPLALRCITPKGDILCAHSLPSPMVMGRFDPDVLQRDLTSRDYEPLNGSAHLMVWGRRHDPELLEDLVERWGISLFLLGHEKAETGAMLVPPNAVVLNSDHERGVYLPIDLSDPPTAEEAIWSVVPLSSVPMPDVA